MISRIHRRAAVVLMVLGLALGIPLGVLASHQFADVPDSNIFHDDIDALVTNGITFGCGGGNFCPSNFVTREQMAAFMNRLGSLDGTTAPSVNADQVDGIDSANLLPGGVLPGGRTIRGDYSLGATAAAAAAPYATGITFGFTMATALTPHFIPAGGVPPAECGGTSANPQAASGHLCVYEFLNINATGQVIFRGGTGAVGATDTWGANVGLFSAAAGNVLSYGSWAATSTGTAYQPPPPSGGVFPNP